MSRAVLSIGSNVGDSLAHLQGVVDGLREWVVAVSPVYATAPWGGVEQQDFLNATVVVDDPAADCREWLRRGQQLEADADRVREQRWGPRTLDVDVVTCDGIRSDDPELTLPHPRAHERAFVLVPWLDIDADATLDIDADATLDGAGGAVRVDDLVARLDPGEIAGVRKTALRLELRSL